MNIVIGSDHCGYEFFVVETAQKEKYQLIQDQWFVKL